MGELVCVTGAAGYVGSHVVRELLEQGFQVRATVRDPKDEKKTAHLRAFPHASERLELFGADLEQAGAFHAALAGVKHLVHTASAVQLAAKDPQREIVDVAVNGTKNALGAALEQGVERVVMTSSVAAVAGDDHAPDYRFSERDWNDTATVKSDAYATSKVHAERAARALVAGKPVRFVAMLPSLVLGPVLAEPHLRTSPVVLHELLKGAWPGIPNLHFGVIDVRDLARAHVRAITLPEPSDRYLCSAAPMGLRAMGEVLRQVCPRAKTPKRGLPDVLMYATALFDKRLTFGFLRKNLGRAPDFDSSRMRAELGIAPRPVHETVADTAKSIERFL